MYNVIGIWTHPRHPKRGEEVLTNGYRESIRLLPNLDTLTNRRSVNIFSHCTDITPTFEERICSWFRCRDKDLQ